MEENWIKRPNYGPIRMENGVVNFADDFAQKMSLEVPNELPPKGRNTAHERIKQARTRAARLRSKSRGRTFHIIGVKLAQWGSFFEIQNLSCGR